jgi:hypothetical protein
MDSEYTITHLGEGIFSATLRDGQVKEVGPNIRGMIRYTYFEDFTLPPVGWEVTKNQLLNDYHPKLMKDIMEGKVRPGIHNFCEDQPRKAAGGDS